MRWCALAAPWLLASCALFLDTGGLSDEDAIGPDGGAETGTAGDATTASDAGGDAASTDSAIAGDGAPPSGSCRETFFDSFDDGAIGAKWNGLSQNGATLSLVQTALSAPNALLVTVGQAYGTATLQKTFSKTKTACCEVAIADYSNYLSLFQFTGQSSNYTLRFAYGSGTFSVSEALYVGNAHPDNYSRVLGLLPQPSSTFRRLRIEIALPAGAGLGTLRVSSDGALALATDIGSATLSLDFDSFAVGVSYSHEQSPGAKVRYDDVGCTLE